MKLAKERFDNSPVKKCIQCQADKRVYIEIKIKETHKDESILCSKICFRKAFGRSITKKT